MLIQDHALVKSVQVLLGRDGVGHLPHLSVRAQMVIGQSIVNDINVKLEVEPEVEIPVIQHRQILVVATDFAEGAPFIDKGIWRKLIHRRKACQMDVAQVGIEGVFLDDRNAAVRIHLLIDAVGKRADTAHAIMQPVRGQPRHRGFKEPRMPSVIIIQQGDQRIP